MFIIYWKIYSIVNIENSGASVPKAINQTDFVDWEPVDLEM